MLNIPAQKTFRSISPKSPIAILKRAGSYYLALILMISFFQPSALAAPKGGQVVGGSAEITQGPDTTVIHQHSDRLAIDWQRFNLASHETVRFQQPSSSSIALNRIFDQNPSSIFGAIEANGRVFLSNPNGMIFGQSATINVGSFVASGLKIHVDDFMAGRFYFNAPTGGAGGIVINRGLIAAATGGSVNLIGGAVSNEGVIVANRGHVNLGAGRKAVLDFDGDGLIHFEVSDALLTNENAATAAVQNSGQITADGGEVLLTASAAQDVFKYVVNNEGIIEAGRIDNSGGLVRLVGIGSDPVIHSGVIDVSGKDALSTGGTVQVLGNKVGLFETASIKASGDTGGGTVLIGGDYQGKNPEIQNATRTFVSKKTVITADALTNGNGGRVIIWADESTLYYGDILARGGALSGDGGFAEVSGKLDLSYRGHTDLSAAQGKMGTILLDPSVIIITPGTNDGTDILQGTTGTSDGSPLIFTNVFPPLPPFATIFQSELQFTPNSILLKADSQILVASGFGSVNPITLFPNITLSMEAGAGGILLSDIKFIAPGTGSISLKTTAGGSIFIGEIDTQTLTVESAGNITQQGAIVVSGISTFKAGDGNVITLDQPGNSFTGDINLSVNGTTGELGSVIVNNSRSTNLELKPLNLSGNLTVTTTSGDINIGGRINNSGVSSISSFSAAGDITMGSGNFFVDGSSIIRAIDLAGTNSSISFSAGGDIHLLAEMDFEGSTSTFEANNITLGNKANTFVGDISLSASPGGTLQNVTIKESTDLELPGFTLFGNLIASSENGNISQRGAITNTGSSSSSTFTAGNDKDITLADDGNSFNGILSFSASTGTLQNVTIKESTDLELPGFTLSGALTATSKNGNISQRGAITNTGSSPSSTFTVGNKKDITLGNLSNIFDGTLSFLASTGTLQNVTIKESTDLELPGFTLSGNLIATSRVSVSQSGAIKNLDLTGSSSFSIRDLQLVSSGVQNPFGRIILDKAANEFKGSLSFLASVEVASPSTRIVPVALAAVTIRETTDLDLPVMSIKGSLIAISNGNITQAGPITNTGSSTFTAGNGNNITLGKDNSFGGTLSFLAATDTGNPLNNVTIKELTSLDLPEITLSGDLIATSGGDITQSGAITNNEFKTATFKAKNITLLSDNIFNGNLSFLVSGSGTLGDVKIKDDTALDLPGFTLSGNLEAISGGDLTQSGAIISTGNKSTFTAKAGTNITLAKDGNSFGRTLTFLASGTGDLNNVSITDSTDLFLPGFTLSGNLEAISGGDITQSGAIISTGTDKTNMFTSGNLDSKIILNDKGNNFGGVVTLSASASGSLIEVSISDSTNLQLSGITLSGNFTATSSGSITQSGAIINTGPTGKSTFEAGHGNDITLNNIGNNFVGALSFSALNPDGTTGTLKNVTLKEGSLNDLVLPDLKLSGTLTVASEANITQASGLGIKIDVGVNSTFKTGLRDITLNNDNNVFTGSVGFLGTPRNVSISDTTGLELLAGFTVAEDLNATSGGSITQTGAFKVTGSSTFTAIGSIDLGNLNNDFGGTLSFAGKNGATLDTVIISSKKTIDLPGLTLSGNLTVTSEDSITQRGLIDVAGSSTFTAQNGSDIILGNKDNSFGTTLALLGSLRDVTISSKENITLPAINFSRNLTVNSGGSVDIADASGMFGANSSLTVNTPLTGSTTISQVNDGATLDLNGINTGTMTISSTGNFSIASLNTPKNFDLNLSGSTVSLASMTVRSLEVTATTKVTGNLKTTRLDGDLKIDGKLTLNGEVSLSTEGGDILLAGDVDRTNGTDQLTLNASGGNVELKNIGLSSTPLASLSIVSSGTTTLSGDIFTNGDTGIDFSQANNVILSPDPPEGRVILSNIKDGGSIRLGRNVGGTGQLRIESLGGIVDLGEIGLETAPLAGLSFTGVKTLKLNDDIHVDGALNLNRSNVGDIVLTQDLTIKSEGGINANSSNFGGEFSLTLDAGSKNITIGSVGQNELATLLGALSVISSGQTTLTGDITTNGIGGIDLSRALHVKLSNEVIIDTSAKGGAVKLNGGLVDGPEGLTIKAGTGQVVLGKMGTTPDQALAFLKIESSASIEQEANIKTKGTVTLSSSGNITMSANAVTTSNSNAINYTSTEGNVLIGQLNAGTADVTVVAGESIFNNQREFLDLNTTETGPINIKGNKVSLNAGNRIGESIFDAIAIDAPKNKTITLNFTSEEAFIRNLNASNLNDCCGILVNGLVESLAATQRSESAVLKQTAFNDRPELIEENHLLVTVMSPGFGSATEMGQARQITSLDPVVPDLIRTPFGWRFLRKGSHQEEKGTERKEHDREISEKFKEGFKYSTDPFSSQTR